ncbi:MAG: YabP/YqfC family sporulation protein [Oscillospiraceae bacterium]|nr:YabP/YqfC family sporulation protein [Oscillospiraceae bacterium]
MGESEVLRLKTAGELPAELCERLMLPQELFPGVGRLTLSGGRQALIEGQRGILEYTSERIVVSFGREKLSLGGEGLKLQAMNAGELLITGRIRAAEWG